MESRAELVDAAVTQPIERSEPPEAEEPNLQECEKVEHDVAFGGGGAGADEVAVQAAEPSVDAARADGVVKRKRGRPPKSRGGGSQGVRVPVRKKDNEEAVCFVCYDGGSLVICDRRGCPKVYHPSCINKDDDFLGSKGRWNCGWHICSNCPKSAHYMCYSCTYSSCRRCIKEAEFICIRGLKGFCETCYRAIMRIELNEVGGDFDDEYLFKLYWFKLKENLSFSIEELSNAKNPKNEDFSDESYNVNDDQESSSDSYDCHVGSNSSRKKSKRHSKISVAGDISVNQVPNESSPTSEDTLWASKALLEFVAHMKDGNRNILSQFDVQDLLLEYIKRNNLRDPRRKSQIICDTRLQNLFGKARVGHFEMLKLLEFHFLIKEAPQVVTDNNEGGVIDPDSNQMDAEGYRRRKGRKRFEDREPQTNLDSYAAIDVHNINLIYLSRGLMEGLIDDIDKFNEKVVGAFVRIRIPGTGQRQDMYRLVQVVGTHTATEKYKLGKKTTNITLEILNLDKAEVISIDTISNQEFTEEECKRLRQSVKCGFINPLKVGEVQDKIRALQALRMNDLLENEKLRLSHLRDRASEKGRRKELRECVEKLQLLSTPEERRRRLNEIPEIHADPNMDPSYESSDEEQSDDKEQNKFGRPRGSLSLRKGEEFVSSEKKGSVVSNNWGGGRRSSDVINSGLGSPNPVANTTGVEAGGWNNHSYSAATVPSDSADDDNIWNYLDPSGRTQGPFSMHQLRKWNTTGYFPSDLRIWRVSENQDKYLPLTDALIGKFQKDSPHCTPHHNTFPHSAIANRFLNQSSSWSGPNIGVGLRGSETSKDPNAWSNQPRSQPYSYPQSPTYQGRGAGIDDSAHGFESDSRLANESTNQWGYDPFNPPSPTPQPSSGCWAKVQGSANISSVPFKHANTGLGASGVNTTMESNNAVAVANSVGGWGSSPDGCGSWSHASSPVDETGKKADAGDAWGSKSAASDSIAEKLEGTDASLISGGFNGSDAPVNLVNPLDISAPLDGSASNELSGGMRNNRFLHGDCPSPTPLSEDLVRSNTLSVEPQNRGQNADSFSWERPQDTNITEWSLPSPTPATKTFLRIQDEGSGTAQGNANTSWGTSTQGNKNKGWGAPQQENTSTQGNTNKGWGAPQQENTSNAGWGSPTLVNTWNPGWEASSQGNSNLNPGLGANENAGRGAGKGNSDSWGSQKNNRMRSSRPPPRGQGQAGVCKFYQNGYCKKGPSCNYLHS